MPKWHCIWPYTFIHCSLRSCCWRLANAIFPNRLTKLLLPCPKLMNESVRAPCPDDLSALFRCICIGPFGKCSPFACKQQYTHTPQLRDRVDHQLHRACPTRMRRLSRQDASNPSRSERTRHKKTKNQIDLGEQTTNLRWNVVRLRSMQAIDTKKSV